MIRIRVTFVENSILKNRYAQYHRLQTPIFQVFVSFLRDYEKDK